MKLKGVGSSALISSTEPASTSVSKGSVPTGCLNFRDWRFLLNTVKAKIDANSNSTIEATILTAIPINRPLLLVDDGAFGPAVASTILAVELWIFQAVEITETKGGVEIRIDGVAVGTGGDVDVKPDLLFILVADSEAVEVTEDVKALTAWDDADELGVDIITDVEDDVREVLEVASL